MNDSYDSRCEAALRRLEEARLSRFAAQPPWFRLLRGLGLRVRPPHYAPIWANVMGHGVIFAFLWGVLMWLLAWRGAVPPEAAAVAAVACGLLFGLVVAFLYRATAERSGLGRWEDLPGR